MEGVTDAQTRQMAENLEFKGPARDEVSTSTTDSCECHVTFLIWLDGSVNMWTVISTCIMGLHVLIGYHRSHFW